MLSQRPAVAVPAALVVALAVGGTASGQQVRIVHSPPAAADAFQSVGIEAALPGDVRPERVAEADVVVEQPDGGFLAFPLAVSTNVLFGEIPAAAVRPPRIRYYIRLLDADGTLSTTPADAPGAGLFSVPVNEDRAVPAPDDWAAGGIDILSPPPGEIVDVPTPTVAVVFVPPLTAPWDVLVTLDGTDMTDAAELSPDALVLDLPGGMADGAHRVTVSAIDASGPAEASWVFFMNEMPAPNAGVLDATSPDVTARALRWSSEGTVPTSERWDVSGNIEVGWAYVTADTTESDSLDVFLTYEETSRPTIDFYASGSRGDGSFLVTAQHNPIYNDELDWRVEARNRSLGLECGSVFPSLSATTLDWASGLGAVLEAGAGRASATLLGMRISESDTLAGFGIYSRFALGGEVTYAWDDGLQTSLVHVSVLDREQSVSEEQRITEPLRNHATSGIIRAKRGILRGELEVAQSSSSGDYEGDGVCARASAGLEKGLDNRVSLEYVSCSEDYYSAGSFDTGPGEESLELEFACRPLEPLRLSGWAEAFTGGPQQSPDGYGLRAYGRSELSWDAGGGLARAYAIARHDRVPYDTYDYVYSYGSLGGSWRRGPMRVLSNGSWSRSRSPEAADTWTASGEIRCEVRPRVWTVRAGARWALGIDDGARDYSRVQYTLATRLVAGEYDLHAEYWLIDRDDREEPEQTHTEHVITVSVGHSF